VHGVREDEAHADGERDGPAGPAAEGFAADHLLDLVEL